MNYQECIDYILSIPLFAAKLGTDNLNKILDIMGHPERSFPVIHVAGTNGKGSTCSFLASILSQKGYRVGIFTSPHLIRLNERIRVNKAIISDDDLVVCFEEVMSYVKEAGKTGIMHPSFFEFVFLMGVLYFSKQKVDYAIIETGMGGRLDATNIVKPKLCIITSVGMDHMQYLGDTIERIAEEKAGIIKENVPVVFFDREDGATPVIYNKCRDNGGILYIIKKKQYKILKITKKTIDFSFESEYYRYDDLKVRKTALYQVENAVLAVRAYELLINDNLICDDITKELIVSDNENVQGTVYSDYHHNNIHRDIDVIRKGILEMEWPGRMQKIADRIYVDGAHNEEAIIAFCHTLEVVFKNERKLLIFAVSKDKDYRTMIEHLGRISFDEIVIVRYKGDRSADIDTVKSIFTDVFSDTDNGFSESRITAFDDIRTGLEYAKAHVGDRLIFCVGSLYLVGDLLSLGV